VVRSSFSLPRTTPTKLPIHYSKRDSYTGEEGCYIPMFFKNVIGMKLEVFFLFFAGHKSRLQIKLFLVDELAFNDIHSIKLGGVPPFNEASSFIPVTLCVVIAAEAIYKLGASL
jgi:hypothetical protein